MIRRYYFQDGADFYLFDSPVCDGDPLIVATYPIKVKDFDQDGAMKARVWFIQTWCRANNVYPLRGEA